MGKFAEDVADETVVLSQKKQIGQTFWRSSAVLTDAFSGAGTLSLTNVATRGDLLVEDVIIKTTNGIGGVGTLKLISNNAKGTVTIFEEGITLLGSSVTVDLAGSRLRELLEEQGLGTLYSNERANNRTILEEGKRLELEIVGASTGAGEFDVFVQFRRLAEYADIKML